MAMSLYFPLPPHLTISSLSAITRPSVFYFDNPPPWNKICSRKRRQRAITSALKEWQEYEDAVKDKDLARALRFLKDISIEPDNDSSMESSRPPEGELGLIGWERDWEVLDTCLNAEDMRLVGTAYSFLQNRGFLPNFGKCRNIGTPSTHRYAYWLK